MHVSINGLDVSVLTKCKAVVFINTNVRFTELMGGRDENTYWKCRRDIKLTTARRDSDYKYSAVNWKGDRLEFRMFRGNRKWDGFLKNIEFTHATLSFAREASCSDLTPKAFVNFVNRRASQFGEYRTLARFIANTKEVAQCV